MFSYKSATLVYEYLLLILVNWKHKEAQIIYRRTDGVIIRIIKISYFSNCLYKYYNNSSKI